MKLSEELAWRGLAAEHTFSNPAELDEKTRKFYWGTDPSADSLHIGHLAALMMIRCFIRHGYEPTLLVGGGTGLIGDPKMDKARPIKPVQEVEANARSLTAQLEWLMGEDIRIVNNIDWLGGIGFFKFQEEVGRHFSMTQLMDRDFVKARTGAGGTGISVAEFSYSLLQGYDFLYLYRTYGIDLQLCGVDQMGNCFSGLHLISKAEKVRADVWSCPLIIDKSSGKKFGKSEGNAIWLDPTKTTPYQFYQFWLNTDDAGVIDYLKIYTLLDKDEIEALAEDQAIDPSARAAQRKLAHEVTMLVHGRAVTESVERVTRVLFGEADFQELTTTDIDNLASEIPTAAVGSSVVAALVESGLAPSNSAANRLIGQHAISVNGKKITTDLELTTPALVKKGKNNFILVR